MNINEAFDKAADINVDAIVDRAAEIGLKIDVSRMVTAVTAGRTSFQAIILASIAMGFEAGRLYETGARTYGDIDPASRTAQPINNFVPGVFGESK